MSLPDPSPAESGWSRSIRSPRVTEPSPAHTTTVSATRRQGRGLPGARVVAAATLVVVTTALVEVLLEDRIGLWTDLALVTVAVVAALITRAGDRSLPAMMPPLAFLTAALIAGQLLLPPGRGSLRRREAFMLVDVLGTNAQWVVAASLLATTIALVRHLWDRR